MDYTRRPLAVFFAYYRPHLALLAADMLCAVLIAAIDVAFPMFSRYALDTLIPNGNLRLFLILVAALLAGFGLRWLCNWFVNYWGHVFGNRIEQDMRRDVFDRLESLPFSFYDTHRTGKIMARATTDLFEITELAHHGPEDFLIAVLTILGSFFLLLKIRWELAVIVIASRRSLSRTSVKVKERTAEVNANLESSISGIRMTKGFANEDFERERFAIRNQEYSRAKQIRFRFMAFFHSNIELCNNLLSLIVLAVGGFLIMRGRMTLPDLVASFTAPVRKLTNFVEQFTTGMVGFQCFLEIMRAGTEPADSADAGSTIACRRRSSGSEENQAYGKSFHSISASSSCFPCLST